MNRHALHVSNSISNKSQNSHSCITWVLPGLIFGVERVDAKANVCEIVQQFNRTKTADVSFKNKSGRKRELMRVKEEHHLMVSLEDKALNGQKIGR